MDQSIEHLYLLWLIVSAHLGGTWFTSSNSISFSLSIDDLEIVITERRVQQLIPNPIGTHLHFLTAVSLPRAVRYHKCCLSFCTHRNSFGTTA